jgi:transposase
MSQKELSRVHVISKVIERTMRQREAGHKLGLSPRQVRRLVKRVRKQGANGLVHGLRGKASNRRISDTVWQKILKLYRRYYYDFGPTLASEKLNERNKITISDETLRKRLLAEGMWEHSRKARKHHKWRERKACFGEMIQLDGSHHHWFEERGKGCVLMGYIDDATGRKSGQFYAYEGTVPVFAGIKQYIKQNGIPFSVYVDKHTTYKAYGKPSIEDQLNDRLLLSQFERACKELGIQVIHAHSPQAKGRIERSFKTDQDRLVKELRLAQIQTIAEANEFLKGYWPKHNKRFAVQPVKETDLHRPIPADIDLDTILSIQTERVVRNDFTIVHEKKMYQIISMNCPRKVIVEERINGQILIRGNNRYLNYKPIQVKPTVKPQPKPERTIWRPAVDHPWKSGYTQKNGTSKQEALAVA